MARVSFSEHLRHLEPVDQYDVPETCTVHEALMCVFSAYPRLQHRILDEQGILRRSVSVFLDGRRLQDPLLKDLAGSEGRITVLPALNCCELF